MSKRTELVALVRSYCGTPYAPHQRKPGLGMDCPAPVICGTRTLGLVPLGFDVQGYALQPDGHSLREFCDRFMHRIETAAIQAGDVCLCAFGDEPERHLGVVTDATPGRMYWVEAESKRFKQVRETRLILNSRAMRVTQAYRIPGIDG
jgi:hypothetical protein